MNKQSLHRQFKQQTQAGGFMPSYWSCVEISLGNDRTPIMGSRRMAV